MKKQNEAKPNMKGCDKKIDIYFSTIYGTSEKAETRCGWYKSNEEKYYCDDCKKKYEK